MNVNKSLIALVAKVLKYLTQNYVNSKNGS